MRGGAPGAAWDNERVPAVSRPRRSRAPVDVFRYRDYREFLAAFYTQGKAAGLSYRGFARSAGLGAPNYLKLVIEGKRNLSAEMAERFARACRLNAESTEYFTLLVAFNQATGDVERNSLHEALSRFARFRSSQRLDLAQKEYHSSWFIPAIRELVSCAGFREDAAWIAEQLEPSISEKDAAHALEVLCRLGLLERDESGKLVQATRAVSTGEQASGLYIRNYHAEAMQRAVFAMHHLPAEERYISALTLSASPATLAEVRRRVIELRQQLIALCDADPAASRVVQLNLQLFPLSRSIGTPPSAAGAEPLSGPARARRTASNSKKDRVS
jgi:uncharacterized protein (TIGR02147 family)